MLVHLKQFARKLFSRLSVAANQLFGCITQPARPNLVTGTLADLLRARSELLAENALLRQLVHILTDYIRYFNQARLHQSIAQRIPEITLSPSGAPKTGKVIGFPVLNGLHHDYRWAA